MFRPPVLLATVAVAAVSATINLGTVAGFPAPDLSNVKLTAREPAPAAGAYIAGFPMPNV